MKDKKAGLYNNGVNVENKLNWKFFTLNALKIADFTKCDDCCKNLNLLAQKICFDVCLSNLYKSSKITHEKYFIMQEINYENWSCGTS